MIFYKTLRTTDGDVNTGYISLAFSSYGIKQPYYVTAQLLEERLGWTPEPERGPG